MLLLAPGASLEQSSRAQVTNPKPLVPSARIRSRVCGEGTAHGTVLPVGQDIVVSRPVVGHVQKAPYGGANVRYLRVGGDLAEPARQVRDFEGREALRVLAGDVVRDALRHDLGDECVRRYFVVQAHASVVDADLLGLGGELRDVLAT